MKGANNACVSFGREVTSKNIVEFEGVDESYIVDKVGS